MAETRAVILAAGRGSRLGSITADRPKCLVRLAGRALLDWQLMALKTARIHKVAIVAGYRSDQIDRPEVKYFHNPQWATSSIVSSLCCAAEWLESCTCVVSYGDIVYHPEIVSSLLKSRHDITVPYDLLWRSLWTERFEQPEDDAESFRIDKGLVVQIGQKGHPLDFIQGQYLGLLKFTPKGWKQMESYLSRLPEGTVRTLDMTSLLQGLIQERVEVAGLPIYGRWCEVDTSGDLELYEQKIKTFEGWTHDWRFQGDSSLE